MVKSKKLFFYVFSLFPTHSPTLGCLILNLLIIELRHAPEIDLRYSVSPFIPVTDPSS